MPAPAHLTHQNRKRFGGFALLEALVAIVLVAGAGSALFALINTGLQGLTRAEAHAMAAAIQPDVLAWIRHIEIPELAEQHTAQFSITRNGQDYQVNATFDRMRAATTRSPVGQQGIHLIALYNVDVNILEDTRLIDRYVTRKVESLQYAPTPQF